MITPREHAERMKAMSEEFDRADARNGKLARLLAPVVALIALLLVLCVVAATVGATWWVLTGRPLLGG